VSGSRNNNKSLAGWRKVISLVASIVEVSPHHLNGALNFTRAQK